MTSTNLTADQRAFEANVWKSYLYRFVMDLQLWLPIWVIYLQQQRGFSLTQITLLDTPFFLLIVLAEVPTGAVADRFGRRVSLMLGSGLFAIALLVFGVADSYAIIIVSYVAWGLALTFQSGADTALLYDSLKASGREHDFTRINGRLFAIRSIAALMALLIGAPLAAATSYTFVIMAGAAFALAALPVAFFMHEPRHVDEDGHEPYFRTLVSGVRDVWHAPPLRYIILYSGVLSACTLGPTIFQQPLLADHGISAGDFGWWLAPVRVIAIIAGLSAAWTLSHIGERAAFFAMPVVLGVSSLALAGIDNSWVFVAFLGVGAVHGLQTPVLENYINHRIDSRRRATILSVQNVAMSLILAAVNPLGGIIADRFGLQSVFLMYAAATLVLGLGSLLLWHRAERRSEGAFGAPGTQSEIVALS